MLLDVSFSETVWEMARSSLVFVTTNLFHIDQPKLRRHLKSPWTSQLSCTWHCAYQNDIPCTCQNFWTIWCYSDFIYTTEKVKWKLKTHELNLVYRLYFIKGIEQKISDSVTPSLWALLKVLDLAALWSE